MTTSQDGYMMIYIVFCSKSMDPAKNTHQLRMFEIGASEGQSPRPDLLLNGMAHTDPWLPIQQPFRSSFLYLLVAAMVPFTAPQAGVRSNGSGVLMVLSWESLTDSNQQLQHRHMAALPQPMPQMAGRGESPMMSLGLMQVDPILK